MFHRYSITDTALLCHVLAQTLPPENVQGIGGMCKPNVREGRCTVKGFSRRDPSKLSL